MVSDYVVVLDGTEKLIAHRDTVSCLNATTHPLRIVGVTEHLAYWKDIRRVLFADNEFTMLCRLSRSGIQNDWNPIKVADIFKEFAPDLSQQIELASKAAMIQSAAGQSDERFEPVQSQMALALARYKDILLSKMQHSVTDAKLLELDRFISSLALEDASAEGQRAAFAKVKASIEVSTKQQIDTLVDLAARETVRTNLGLPLFPTAKTKENRLPEVDSTVIEEREANLLDVEIIAIYW